MSTSKRQVPPPRLALTAAEAADSLGVGRDCFREHIKPTLRIVRIGRRQLVPVSELERWLYDNAAITMDAD